MTPLNRPVERQLSITDIRSNKPIVLRIQDESGDYPTLALKVKGERKWRSVTLEKLWDMLAGCSAPPRSGRVRPLRTTTTTNQDEEE